MYQRENGVSHQSKIIEQLHEAVAVLRDVLAELHPVDLEEFGLVSALINLCKRYSRFTGRSIVFNAQSEDCNLSEHQQLCLYRAVQTVLKMFALSNNDFLVLACDSDDRQTLVTMSCIDKRVASADWLLNRDCALFKKLAVEMERKRIAEDINKAIVPQLENVKRLALRSIDKHLRKEIKNKMRVIGEGVDGVIAELHPDLIDKVGMVASLRTLVARFRHATLIETAMISNLWFHQFESIPPGTKLALYRVVQEALNNIEKHSDATRTLVTVTANADQLVVCIEDNGKGIVLAKKHTVSRGLRIIKERATAIGASIKLQESTSFESGTLVTISLPCSGLVIDTQLLYKGIAPR